MKTVNSYNDVGDILCDRNKSDENEPLSHQLWVWELQIYFVYSPAKGGLTELWCFLCPEHEQATKQTVELPVIETPMAFMRNHCIMELLFECVHACWWDNDSNSLQAYAWQESTSTVYWCIASKLKAPWNFYWMSNMFLWVEIFLFFVCYHVVPKRHSQLDYELNGL